MKPLIVQSRATGAYFCLTRYTIVKRMDPKTKTLVTGYKHQIRDRQDVTDQIRAILQADRKRRAAA